MSCGSWISFVFHKHFEPEAHTHTEKQRERMNFWFSLVEISLSNENRLKNNGIVSLNGNKRNQNTNRPHRNFISARYAGALSLPLALSFSCIFSTLHHSYLIFIWTDLESNFMRQFRLSQICFIKTMKMVIKFVAAYVCESVCMSVSVSNIVKLMRIIIWKDSVFCDRSEGVASCSSLIPYIVLHKYFQLPAQIPCFKFCFSLLIPHLWPLSTAIVWLWHCASFNIQNDLYLLKFNCQRHWVTVQAFNTLITHDDHPIEIDWSVGTTLKNNVTIA